MHNLACLPPSLATCVYVGEWVSESRFKRTNRGKQHPVICYINNSVYSIQTLLNRCSSTEGIQLAYGMHWVILGEVCVSSGAYRVPRWVAAQRIVRHFLRSVRHGRVCVIRFRVRGRVIPRMVTWRPFVRVRPRPPVPGVAGAFVSLHHAQAFLFFPVRVFVLGYIEVHWEDTCQFRSDEGSHNKHKWGSVLILELGVIHSWLLVANLFSNGTNIEYYSNQIAKTWNSWK